MYFLQLILIYLFGAGAPLGTMHYLKNMKNYNNKFKFKIYLILLPKYYCLTIYQYKYI